MITVETLFQRYDDLTLNKQLLFLAMEAELEAKLALEAAKAAALAAGVEGKNAEQREANLRLMLADRYENLTECERETRLRRSDADYSALKVEHARQEIRLRQVLAGEAGEGAA